MFVANSKMNESGQKWAKGLEPSAPEGVLITEFELKVAELGLEQAQYADSKSLRDWVTGDHEGSPRYNVLYVPEFLLYAWGIVTSWDGDEIDESLMTPFSDMSSTTWENN